MSWPTRQHIKGRIDQVIAAAVAVLAGWVAVHALRFGFFSMFTGATLLAAGAAFGFTRAGRRAVRARIGRLSERAARRELAKLASRDWHIVHSLRWPRRGDIDHVAIAPSGMTFVIETKTRTYTGRHLHRTREAAAAVRAQRPDAPVHAVLCVARDSIHAHWQDDVLVVGLSGLAPALTALERRYAETARARASA